MQNKIKLIKDFKPRPYQESIFVNSLNKNTLVVLPTGLGKTIIALMLSTYYFNNYPNKKILFLAPTKPLVEQQKKSFEELIENSKEFNLKVLTGKISPEKRIVEYKNANFIFSTPQIIENDIINERVNLDDFSLIIFDEAHRARGDYAYSFIGQNIVENNLKTKILALTASPGTNLEEIKEVMNNLNIEKIEVKTYEDRDVAPFVQETKIRIEKVEIDETLKKVIKLLNRVYLEKINELRKLGLNVGNNLTKTQILELQRDLQREINSNNSDQKIWNAISVVAALMKLSFGIELVESQGVLPAYNYFYEFFAERKNKTKAIESLILNKDFRDAFDLINKLKEKNYIHPKLIKLKEIVMNTISKSNNSKIIIFNQYRENADKITSELNKLKEINSVLFVGQNKKGDLGLSQKEQKKILEDFREDKYNVLVSTSIGEEGLDIPKVDLVIFYEPVPSAIRTIQRAGRTGRFSKGEVIILVANETRDVAMSFVSKAKEKRMYASLEKIKKEFEDKEEKEEKSKNLIDFIKNKENSSNKIKVDKKYEWLVFDYGGVISKYGSLKEIFNFKEKPKEEFEKWLNDTHSAWKLADIGKIDFNEFLKISSQKLNEDFEKHKIEVFNKIKILNEEILNILEELKKKGYKLAILSNNPKGVLDEIIKEYHFEKIFDKIIISGELGVKKPQKEIFEKTTEILKTKKENILFFDDKEKNIYAAKSFGWNVYQFTDIHNFKIYLSKEGILNYSIYGKDERINIFIDSRENQVLLKELSKSKIIKPISKKLDVGDIIISEKIGIERKEKKDFVNSLIDGRLFKQVIKLATSFSRPILILEGEVNIYSLRKISKSAIDNSILSIMTDYRIPIIYTNNIEETREIIENLAKRAIKAKNSIGIQDTSNSSNTLQEYQLELISKIPKINTVTAIQLLKHFKNIKNIVEAKPEDFEKIEGIGKKKAKFIYEFFRKEN
jgi:Fanconi anemia group M protein